MKVSMTQQIVSAVYGNFFPQEGPRILHSAWVQLDKWEFPNQAAPYWRWYWNEYPGAHLILGGQRVDLSPDHIVLIPPLAPFSCFTAKRVSHFYIHFTLAPAYTPVKAGLYSHAACPSELSLIRDFKARLTGPAKLLEWHSGLISVQLVNAALLSLPANTLVERAPHPQIDRAIQLIEAHYPHAQPNARLAKAVSMSSSSFLRQFSRVAGKSPHQYLLTRRIQEACRLMHDPALSLELIAEKTGFCDRFHFTRHFKRHIGIGPALYRRQANLSLAKSVTGPVIEAG